MENMIRFDVKPFTEEAGARAILRQMLAMSIVEEAYGSGRQTLGFHVPPEDLQFQFDSGGTGQIPVMASLESPAGEPILAMPAVRIPCLSHLAAWVQPLFTSPERAQDLLSALEESEMLIPDHVIVTSPWQVPRHQWKQDESTVVVNPLPQIFLAAPTPFLDTERDAVVLLDVGEYG